MSVTLCQYTVGGLCCICTSGCLQSPTICASGGNISTNCCVVAGNICASGGNFTTNCCLAAACVYASNNICTICCIVAPIHCATTCFVGNGSGLTNVPSSGLNFIASYCCYCNCGIQIPLTGGYKNYCIIFSGVCFCSNGGYQVDWRFIPYYCGTTSYTGSSGSCVWQNGTSGVNGCFCCLVSCPYGSFNLLIQSISGGAMGGMTILGACGSYCPFYGCCIGNSACYYATVFQTNMMIGYATGPLGWITTGTFINCFTSCPALTGIGIYVYNPSFGNCCWLGPTCFSVYGWN